jgi:hypothetical protein
MPLCGIDLHAVGMLRDVAKQSEKVALHPPFPSLPSRPEPFLGDPGGVRQPAVEEVRPAERPDAAAGPPRPCHCPLGEATGGVLHQGDPLGAAARPVVRRAQRPGEGWSSNGTCLVRQNSRPRSSGATAPPKSP